MNVHTCTFVPYSPYRRQRAVPMRAVTSTELRQNVFSLLSDVENGERVLVTRHGRVVAELSPPARSVEPAWKRAGPRLPIAGAAVSAAILRERSR